MKHSHDRKYAGKCSVAVVSPGLLPVPPILGGSVETVIQNMAEGTKKRFDVHIYGPSHPSLRTVEDKDNLTYFRFPSRPYPEYFKSVRAHINNRHYNIVQVENRPLFMQRTKAANPDSKFICSLHSLIHISENLISPGLTRKIFMQADKILVYSRFTCEKLAQMFPASSDRLEFIHLATRPDIFRPRLGPGIQNKVKLLKKKYGIPADWKVVLFAGRLIPQKGIHILMAAMEQVLTAFPDCCLVIVGGAWFGSRRISPYIEGLHKQAQNIAGNIRFTSYVRPAEMPDYFAMADVFVCPSQWDEPFGLVNVEAMACGLPVIASARGGIPEVVTDGVNGMLVKEEYSPLSFARALVTLLNDPELAAKFGKAGRKTVEDYFNWERAGRDLTNLYDRMLAR